MCVCAHGAAARAAARYRQYWCRGSPAMGSRQRSRRARAPIRVAMETVTVALDTVSSAPVAMDTVSAIATAAAAGNGFGGVPAQKRRARRRVRAGGPSAVEARGRSHLSNKTPQDRVREYGSHLFRCTDLLLICQFCDKAVDPRRRSSIEYHLKSFTHMRKVNQCNNQHLEDDDVIDSGTSPSGGEPGCDVTDVHDATNNANLSVQTTGLLIASPQTVIKLEPTTGETPIRAADWSGVYNESCQLSAVLMRDGGISSLCETELATPDEPAESFSSSDDHERRCLCSCCCCTKGCVNSPEGKTFPNELVLKARLSCATNRPFVLFELPTSDLTLSRLVAASSVTLGIPSKSVKEVVRLPNTLIRRDKDVKRLLNYQELELVLQDPLLI